MGLVPSHREGSRAWPHRRAPRLTTEKSPASDHIEGPRATEKGLVPDHRDLVPGYREGSHACALATEKWLPPDYREGPRA